MTLRLRGAKTELEEAGEDVDGMAESTSQLQAKLKALTHGKVDIMLDADTFKNTTQILREMSTVWEDMTDIEQAAALELMGGKRQANILSSLISNFETVEDVIETSMSSSGSAIAENEKYLDSIAGKTEQLTNSMQTMWNNAINSDVVKNFLDLAKGAVEAVDKIGLLTTAFAGFIIYLRAVKKISLGSVFKDVSTRLQSISVASDKLKTLGQTYTNIGKMPMATFQAGPVNEYAQAVSGLTPQLQAQRLAVAGLNKTQIEEVMRKNQVTEENIKQAVSENNLINAKQKAIAVTGNQILQYAKLHNTQLSTKAQNYLVLNSTRSLTKSIIEQDAATLGLSEEETKLLIKMRKRIAVQGQLKQSTDGLKSSTNGLGVVLKDNLVPIFTIALSALATLINQLPNATEKVEQFKEAFDELQSSISETEGEISAIESELESIHEQIDTLYSKGSLSTSDAEQLKLLREKTTELERQKDIQEQILSAREHQEEEKSLQMINKMINTTAANQQRAAEKTAKTWKWAGAIIVAAIAAVATYGIGAAAAGGAAASGGAAAAGSGAAASGASASSIMSAGLAGGFFGASIGEKAGYAYGMNKNEVGNSLTEWYESYQKALEEAEKEAYEAEQNYLLKLSESNYEKWKEKLEQVNTLQEEMYNGLQEFQGYISNLEYNDQTKSVIDGYNQMLANIDLSSKKGNIGSQISSIQALQNEYAELSKGVDANGKNIALSAEEYSRYNAIVSQILAYTPSLIQGYDAEGNAIANRNTLLSDSIALLKEQQRLAAYAITYGDQENVDSKNIVDVYKSIVDSKKEAIKNADKKEASDIYNALSKESNITEREEMTLTILGLVDKKQGFFESDSEFIMNNAAQIAKNYDIIDQKAKVIFNEYDYTAYMKYIDTLLGDVDDYQYVANKLKSTLSTVPQSLDAYYDGSLSGSGIDFINQYISAYVDGIENIEDLTDNEVVAIRDHIAEFSNVLAEDTSVQNAIAELFELDSSDIPVGEYKQEAQKIWDSISPVFQQFIDEGVIDQNTVDELYGQLVINDENLNDMVDTISAKLNGGADRIEKELSYSEIKIAYRVVADLWGPIDYSELIQKINEQKVADFNITDYYGQVSGISGNISTLVESLEKLESGNLTLAEYFELVEQFPEAAEGVDLASGTYKGLATNLRQLIKKSPKQLIKDLKSMREQLLAAGKSTTAVDQLIDTLENIPEDSVKDLAKHYITLADNITKAKNAQLDLQTALEEDETGYDTRVTGIDKMKELMGRGEIGSESQLWDIAKEMGFTYDSAQSINDNADALARWIAQREKWYKTDDDGNYTYEATESFIEDVEKMEDVQKFLQEHGGKWSYDNGVFEFDLDNQYWDEFADAIGITSEEFTHFMQQIGKYFNIDWENEDDVLEYLDKIKESAKEDPVGAKQQYGQAMQEGLGQGTNIDLTDRPTVLGKDMREKGWVNANGEYSTINAVAYGNTDGTLAFTVTPILPDGTTLTPEQLQEYTQGIIDKSNKGEDPSEYEFTVDGKTYTGSDIILGTSNGENAIDDAHNLADAINKAQGEYQELSDPLDIEHMLDSGSAVPELQKITELLGSIQEFDNGITVFDETVFTEALKNAGYSETQIAALIEKIKEYQQLITITPDDPLGLNNTNRDIQTVAAALGYLQINYNTLYDETTGKPIGINIEANDLITTLSENGWDAPQIAAYLQTLTNSENGLGIQIDGQINMNAEQVQAAIDKANEVPAEKQTQYDVTGTGVETLADIASYWSDVPLTKSTLYTINEVTKKTTQTWNPDTKKWELSEANGTAHAQGTAYAGGSWGAKKTETALTGELGPELLVRDGRWQTIGENGAEFTQIKKGDIIFNHKQTESLLKNGYVTSRGKAYASGTALASGGGTFAKYQFSGDGGFTKYDVNDNVVDTFGDVSDSLSDAAESISDAADEFKEVFDWIEVRLEEIEEAINLLSAQIENASSYADKNKIIDEVIGANNLKLTNLEAGYKEYADYAAKLLTEIPEKYHDAVKNGAIAIEKFVGEADETTLEAINNYRDWAQKAADLKQQAEEVITTIRDLAIQKIDNAQDSGNVRLEGENLQNEKLQNAIDLMEEMGYVASSVYYGINGGDAASSTGMFENAYKKIEYMTKARDAMQAAFNDAVKAGQIIRGSNEWYEQIHKLYEADAEIDEATKELEEFQNAINEIYWDNFDELINRLDYLKDETQGLIDLMEKSGDLVAEPTKRKHDGGTIEFWTEDDVEFTKEGIASLGLYAQQMEIAEYTARQYAEAIDDLDKEFKAGRYSESEYLEKLNELKDGQYENIESYYEAREAIVDLNEARIDSIKEGIEAEVSALEELIDKKKEALDAEKDLYDFNKSAMEQQKSIADIQRKLAALATDNSASAIAQRKRLEAELAEAQASQEEMYYDRSINNQQEALDKELENFQKEKDAEIEKWEEYLTNIEQVITDSLGIVQANATEIGQTLTDKANEYNLTLSDAILTPWQDGAFAVSDYQTAFDTAMSSTTDQLKLLEAGWQSVIDKMQEAAQVDVANINAENAKYAEAKKEEPKQTTTTTTKTDTKKEEPSYTTYTVKKGDTLSRIASVFNKQGYNTSVNKIFNDNKDKIKNKNLIYPGQQFKIKKYAAGTLGTKSNQLAWIDELGEELVMHADGSGKLAFLSKGSSVIPHDISENLMKLGQLDPSAVLDQNRPSIGIHPEIHNTEIHVDNSIAELIHIDNCSTETLPDVEKIVNKALDQHMKNLNNSLRRYTR